MRNITRSLALTLLSVTAAFTTSAQGATIYQDFSSLGAISSPKAIDWNLSTLGGSAQLSLELAGYKSLDGAQNGYTDIFHLLVNGAEIFTGSFNMGGGGSNSILYNPNRASVRVTTFGATDDPQNSHQVTWAGGSTHISLPIDLLLGANQLQFSYSGVTQGLQDEGWGINMASIDMAAAKISVPEPNTFILLIAGFLSIIVLRRKAT